MLSERGGASTDAADKTRKRLAVAKAEVNHAEVNLLKTKTALGDQSEEDVRIQSARIKLKFAQLDLSYTRVKATVNGFVVNVTPIPACRDGGYTASGRQFILFFTSTSC